MPLAMSALSRKRTLRYARFRPRATFARSQRPNELSVVAFWRVAGFLFSAPVAVKTFLSLREDTWAHKRSQVRTSAPWPMDKKVSATSRSLRTELARDMHQLGARQDADITKSTAAEDAVFNGQSPGKSAFRGNGHSRIVIFRHEKYTFIVQV